MENNVIIPSHIQIETVAGICNYACIMCPIDQSLRHEIMSNEKFVRILEKLKPHLADQQFLSLCGLGETLIDRGVTEKIRAAKSMGFRGTGIYTNGELLTEAIAQKLLDVKLDTLIISIDGFTAETQAKIRVHSHLNVVVANTERFIAVRENHTHKTRLMIRFTRQELNKHEEKDFFEFWKAKIQSGPGDTISVYNVHNAGDTVALHVNDGPESLRAKVRGKKLKCSEVYERLDIASDGSINFCCGDQFGKIRVGNILAGNLPELYNSETHRQYRAAMEEGRIFDLELCKNCSVACSIATRAIHGSGDFDYSLST